MEDIDKPHLFIIYCFSYLLLFLFCILSKELSWIDKKNVVEQNRKISWYNKFMFEFYPKEKLFILNVKHGSNKIIY